MFFLRIIEYDNIDDGINAIYNVTATAVIEKIIVNKKPKGTLILNLSIKNKYSFNSADGKIIVYDPVKPLAQIGYFDQPFYIGIFEVTQRQWELVMGQRPSYFVTDDY